MTQESTRGPGRPEHAPTDETRRVVETMAGFGIPQKSICLALGISQMTMAKHYADELERGAGVVEKKLVANLLRLSGGDGPTAMQAIKFALQCRFGWSQYVPRQVNEEPEGKKAAAAKAAHTAHEESDWADLVH